MACVDPQAGPGGSELQRLTRAICTEPHDGSVRAWCAWYGGNLPDSTTFTRPPSGSACCWMFILESTALMMPSPNSSWISSLMVVPSTFTISYQRWISGSIGVWVGSESLYGTTCSHFCSFAVKPKISPFVLACSAFSVIWPRQAAVVHSVERPTFPATLDHCRPWLVLAGLGSDDFFSDVVAVHCVRTSGLNGFIARLTSCQSGRDAGSAKSDCATILYSFAPAQ